MNPVIFCVCVQKNMCCSYCSKPKKEHFLQNDSSQGWSFIFIYLFQLCFTKKYQLLIYDGDVARSPSRRKNKNKHSTHEPDHATVEPTSPSHHTVSWRSRKLTNDNFIPEAIHCVYSKQNILGLEGRISQQISSRCLVKFKLQPSIRNKKGHLTIYMPADSC